MPALGRRRFGVDDPVLLKQRTQKSGEAFGIRHILKAPAESWQLKRRRKGSPNSGDELAPEDAESRTFTAGESTGSEGEPHRAVDPAPDLRESCTVHMGIPC